MELVRRLLVVAIEVGVVEDERELMDGVGDARLLLVGDFEELFTEGR